MALGCGGPHTNGRSQKGRKPGENIPGKQIDFGEEIAKTVTFPSFIFPTGILVHDQFLLDDFGAS